MPSTYCHPTGEDTVALASSITEIVHLLVVDRLTAHTIAGKHEQFGEVEDAISRLGIPCTILC